MRTAMQGTAESLLSRLEAIAAALSGTGHGLAVIGLGSVGLETERLDEHSDLDFFAIVERGFKARYLDHLDWLESVGSIAYCFRNTFDGYKLLYADGVFCEFAVFEPQELQQIPFSPGRIVWKRDGMPDALAIPAPCYLQVPERSLDWLLGEIVTNLYSGMNRYLRGERLSASRLVQHFAVDRLLELEEFAGKTLSPGRDTFAVERRAEMRFPQLKDFFPLFVQGYDRTPEAATAILEYVSSRYELNRHLVGVVQQLIESAGSASKISRNLLTKK
jgi:hypothetical protein